MYLLEKFDPEQAKKVRTFLLQKKVQLFAKLVAPKEGSRIFTPLAVLHLCDSSAEEVKNKDEPSNTMQSTAREQWNTCTD